MTGPEHYREAERLLDLATDQDGDIVTDDRMTANLLAAAQVHAELARTAVAARNDGDIDAWREVLGVPPIEPSAYYGA